MILIIFRFCFHCSSFLSFNFPSLLYFYYLCLRLQVKTPTLIPLLFFINSPSQNPYPYTVLPYPSLIFLSNLRFPTSFISSLPSREEQIEISNGRLKRRTHRKMKSRLLKSSELRVFRYKSRVLHQRKVVIIIDCKEHLKKWILKLFSFLPGVFPNEDRDHYDNQSHQHQNAFY